MYIYLPTSPSPAPHPHSGTTTHRGVQPNPEPPDTSPARQSSSDGLTHPPNAKASLCHFQASSFHQSAIPSTSNSAQAQQETPGSDRVELKPVAKQSCSAWVLFKVLFSLHPQVIWHPECCFAHPVRRWSNSWPVRSNASQSALIQDSRREGQERGQNQCDVCDLEHRVLLWKCWWNQEFS